MRYSFRSREELRSFFGPDGAGEPQRCVIHLTVFDEAQQVGAAEYTYEGKHRYHGLVLVRIAGGLITHWREYQHIDLRERREFLSGTEF